MDYLTKFNDWESQFEQTDSLKLLLSNVGVECQDCFEQPNQKPQITENDELQIIETPQEFIQIYTKMEQEMENNLNLQYLKHCDLIALQIQKISVIKTKIQSAHDILESLHKKYEFVQEKTNGLQTACENLVDEQQHLLTITMEIDDKLKYFKEFDHVSKMLNMPGEHIVLDTRFKPMLGKLDECLKFLHNSSRIREGDLYLMRYRQAMTRSLTLIKLYFVDSI